jgi:uncharacterized protein YjbI with pentapeptide repeats
VANPEHLKLLQQGVDVWNAWRLEKPTIRPDLSGATLSGVNLSEANLSWAYLNRANLSGANLQKACLVGAQLFSANLVEANLSHAGLGGAKLTWANLNGTDLTGVDPTGLLWADPDMSEIGGPDFIRASCVGANFRGAELSEANFAGADLSGANLEADLMGANFAGANLSRCRLDRANLSQAQLVETNLVDAVLTDCRIYGISAWGVKLSEGTKQHGLIITAEGEPEITTDDLEVAQFLYLLLHNDKIRRVIDTVGKKGVLLLGRFTEGRIVVLERLREELRKRGYLPIVFNFDKPETKDFTETVRLLAGMSKFVIADVTNPKSSPLELQATVPEIMVPFQPIIEQGEKPFAMLQDLWIKNRDWVFEPIEYSSVDRLVETMDAEIIRPAETRSDELVMRRAEILKVRRV